MPELAALFAIGSVLTVIAGVIIYFSELRKYKSPAFVVLEKNLKSVQLRWNDLNKSFDIYSADGKKSEINRQINTVLTITFVAVLFSWLGFFFYLLIYFSIKKLGRNRLSDKVFNSLLVEKELTAAETQSIVDQIRQN